MKESNKMKAVRVAERCQDAYAADRYLNWSNVAWKLLCLGFNEEQTEAIMRSKWARWAADRFEGGHRKCAASAITKWMDDEPNECTIDHIQGLIEGTY